VALVIGVVELVENRSTRKRHDEIFKGELKELISTVLPAHEAGFCDARPAFTYEEFFRELYDLRTNTNINRRLSARIMENIPVGSTEFKEKLRKCLDSGIHVQWLMMDLADDNKLHQLRFSELCVGQEYNTYSRTFYSTAKAGRDGLLDAFHGQKKKWCPNKKNSENCLQCTTPNCVSLTKDNNIHLKEHTGLPGSPLFIVLEDGQPIRAYSGFYFLERANSNHFLEWRGADKPLLKRMNAYFEARWLDNESHDVEL